MIVDLMLTGVKFQAPYQVHIDVPVPAGHCSELECCLSKQAMTPMKADEHSVNVFGLQIPLKSLCSELCAYLGKSVSYR
jgi:hypothetical protein